MNCGVHGDYVDSKVVTFFERFVTTASLIKELSVLKGLYTFRLTVQIFEVISDFSLFCSVYCCILLPLTLQRGVTSTACHAACCHSFVYISTTQGANVKELLCACSWRGWLSYGVGDSC